MKTKNSGNNNTNNSTNDTSTQKPGSKIRPTQFVIGKLEPEKEKTKEKQKNQ